MKHRLVAILSALLLVVSTAFVSLSLNQSAYAASGQMGFRLGKSGRCLTVDEGNTMRGAGIDVENCQSAWLAQGWLYSAGNNVPGLLVSSANTSLCLDDRWANSAPGAAVDLYDCHSSWGAQIWSYDPNTLHLRNANGLCLEITDFNSQQGAAVSLDTCTGNTNEQWYLGV